MRTKFSGILTLLLALVVQVSIAQTKTITGTVLDDANLPLPGANVIIKGTSSGTQTDFDGNYSISASVGQTLTFSYVGFETQEVAVGASNTINVTLQPGSVLEEVVIIGSNTSTKEKSSVSSFTVNAETIKARPNASFVQTLSGQVPGLSISTASGQPGANSTVRIRGVSSINGDTEPLFIIDGAPVDQDNFRSLNPNEIASVTVLKDAGATSIYGNRGANGVIIIKTKSGTFGSDLVMNYVGQVNISNLQDNDYNLMNSQELLTLEKERGSGLGATLTDAEIANARTFDWADYFFDTALTQSHTISASKGGENVSTFISLGFHDQEGLLRSSSLKRFNLRTNLSGKSSNDRFTYRLNLSTNYSKSDEPNNIGTGAVNRNPILGAYQSVPYLSIDDYVDGQFILDEQFDGTFTVTPLLIVDRLRTFDRFDEELKIVGSFDGSYKLTNDITASALMSIDMQQENTLRSEGPNSFNALLFAETGNDTPGFQQENFNRAFSYNQLLSLVYNKEFGKHTFNLGLYSEYFKAHFKNFGYFQEGLDPLTFSSGDGSGFIADNADNDFFVDTANANILESGLFSYFSRADYDYDAKYGITGTVRRDASSRFANSNRWATFYSVAARWNIGNEAFMEDSAFDLLKLRASYGTNGNQDVTGAGLFGGLTLTNSLFQTSPGYQGANSLSLALIGNDALKWETVTTTNLGLDFEVFNRRLRGSVDVYDKTTTDLYLNQPLSAVTAATLLNVNGGELKNTGVDVNLSYTVIRAKEADGFNLDLNFVGNYNKNEIVEFGDGSEEIIGTGQVGGKLGEYFLYRFSRINPENGEILFLTADGEETETPDVDADRVWSDKNILPDYEGSFGFSADYKGFFLTTQFNYVIGVDRFDFDLSGFQNIDNLGNFNLSRDLFDAWTPENTDTNIPRLGADNRSLLAGSDYYLTESDYIRLRFAQFGYTLPSKYLDGTGFTGIKMYVNGENLLTFTDWRGFDAEAQSNTSRIYPTPRTISFGVDLQF
ncbi:SusC/RagA family TonB-linked outer membrane protein [Patiriisocius hiemis]|uniref:SusC/RagA family TonB-linked outer membrane protein n=1 Tax=Patiriisocius hiemis TaxID=3075604 RepID=A0ABU2YFC1_9FLAO|nr:SusC/RagA family TonB-linked outer membrane protein [Constantimarinum sp. W242]MDT0556882.1 SusC/RagA family TonB-linked outer membrane protein [Constantimarinum sp. W242]